MSWAIYILLLAIIGFAIYRHRFFHLPGLPGKSSLVFFALKLIAGLAIWYVYTYYYPQREYADIWKYYDDSEIIYNALNEHPGDYFRLISGIGIDDRIQGMYINNMLHWDQQFENNLFNDSHTIIRFNAILRLISGGNYHTHSLVMCFLAFIGLCAIYHWTCKFLWQWKYAVAFVLFVSPSLLFWSSGVLKEGILFFSFGMLILHAWRLVSFDSAQDDKKMHHFVWIFVSLALLAMTKLYMLVFVLPALVLGIHLIRKPRFAFVKFSVVLLLLCGIAFGIHKTKPKISPFRIIALKQKDFLNLARGGTYLMDSVYVVYVRPDQKIAISKTDGPETYHLFPNTEIIYWKIADDFRDTLRRTLVKEERYKMLSTSPVAGSLMNVDPLEETPSSILKASPAAFWRSVFRPYPWEIKPAMVIPPMLENLLLYLLILLMFVAWKKPSSKSVFWFCVLYAGIALTVTGLTTPVLGALVRYRIIAIPFLIFAILMCIDKERLERRIPLIRKLQSWVKF